MVSLPPWKMKSSFSNTWTQMRETKVTKVMKVNIRSSHYIDYTKSPLFYINAFYLIMYMLLKVKKVIIFLRKTIILI